MWPTRCDLSVVNAPDNSARRQQPPAESPAPVDATANELAEPHFTCDACQCPLSLARRSPRKTRRSAALRRCPNLGTLPRSSIVVAVFCFGRQLQKVQRLAVTTCWHSRMQHVVVSAITLRRVSPLISISRQYWSVTSTVQFQRGAGLLTGHRRLAEALMNPARVQARGQFVLPFSPARPAAADRSYACSVRGGGRWLCSAGRSTCTA